MWLATTTAALETSVLVGDTESTRRYHAVLARYSGQWAMAASELACLGPIDRVLGMGTGRTKKTPEEATARVALQKLEAELS